MGGTLSSNRDFNRVLAQQTPASISMPRFDVKNDVLQQPNLEPLRIPFSNDFPQHEFQNQMSTHSNQMPSFNEDFESISTTHQSNISSPIQSTSTPNIMKYPMKNKFIDEQSQRSTTTYDNSHFSKSDSPAYNAVTYDDGTTVVVRSNLNQHDQRCLDSRLPSSFQPHRSIIERNGRKFEVETKQKTERRYIQCMDENTHRLRYFEVIDCIPCRTVRPYRNRSNLSSKNHTFRSNYQSTLSQVPQNQTKTETNSNFIDRRNLQSSPFALNNPASSDYSLSSTRNSYHSSYDETGQMFKTNEVSNGFKRIDPSFFVDHNGTSTSNGFRDELKSGALQDPLAQAIRSNYYPKKQSTTNDYQTPIMTNRKSQLSNTYPDYMHTSNTNKPSNQPLYSYSKDLYTKI